MVNWLMKIAYKIAILKNQTTMRWAVFRSRDFTLATHTRVSANNLEILSYLHHVHCKLLLYLHWWIQDGQVCQGGLTSATSIHWYSVYPCFKETYVLVLQNQTLQRNIQAYTCIPSLSICSKVNNKHIMFVGHTCPQSIRTARRDSFRLLK